MRPSFFDYAKDERTQDAVICWLIEWSAAQAENTDEQVLRNLGGSFVRSLLAMHKMDLQGEIQNAGIYQQDNRIDALARIRDERTEHVLMSRLSPVHVVRFCQLRGSIRLGSPALNDGRSKTRRRDSDRSVPAVWRCLP